MTWVGLFASSLTLLLHSRASSTGQGRVKFDQFKARTDEIAADLNSSLSRIAQGQSEMNVATQTGDQETADNSTRNESSANFDGARFSSSR